MKINKKSIIFIILVLFIIFVTPIYSKANSYNKYERKIEIARTIQETTIDGGGGGTSSGPYFGTGSGDDPIDNPDKYKPGTIQGSDITTVTNKVGPIFGIITTIGTVVGVLILIIIGIKYMIGSVEEKAEYKKTMLPYLIGAIMLISITGILSVFSGVISNITKWI